MQIKYLRHAAVQVSGSKTVLIDPFLSGNPKAAVSADEVAADYILVTHGHGDHLGDTVAIAKRTGATVVAMVELARWLERQGVHAVDLNVGGSFDFGDGFKVKLTQAWHSSQLPDGTPCGLAVGMLFWLDGLCFYHAGDTALFADMRDTIAPHGIDWAFLPIGDYYTMGPSDALIAAGWLGAKHYLPIHYNTFPAIKQDGAAFAARVQAEVGADCVVAAPGEAIEI